MKWVVDRIIDDMAILENIETLEKKEVNISLLPYSIHEGAVLIDKDNLYVMDETEEERRRRLIEDRFKRLRNNN